MAEVVVASALAVMEELVEVAGVQTPRSNGSWGIRASQARIATASLRTRRRGHRHRCSHRVWRGATNGHSCITLAAATIRIRLRAAGSA